MAGQVKKVSSEVRDDDILYYIGYQRAVEGVTTVGTRNQGFLALARLHTYIIAV